MFTYKKLNIKPLLKVMTRGPGFWIFFLHLITFSYFLQGGGWNQNSVIGEIRQLTEYNSVEISSWKNIAGDVSLYKGNLYSNKSPSVLFVVAPLYKAVYEFSKLLGLNTHSVEYQFFATHWITIFASSIWAALIGPLLLCLIPLVCPNMGQTKIVLYATLLPLSTLLFPYATVAFTHSFESFCVVFFITLWLYYYKKDRALQVSEVFLLGLSLGLTMLSNSLNMVVLPVVATSLFLKQRVNFGKAVFLTSILLCAAGLSLLPQLVYNVLVFDSIYKANRFYLVGFTDPSLFLGVFGKPDFSRLLNIFGIGHRSIFPGHLIFGVCLHPQVFKNFSFPTFPSLLKHGPTICFFAVSFLIILCFNGWHGGSAFGIRYATPALILACIYSLKADKYVSKYIVISLIIGVLVHFVVAATFLYPSETEMNPWINEILPRFFNGRLSEYGYPSFPFPQAFQYKFNFGHLMGLKKLNTLVPLLLIQFLICIKIFSKSYLETASKTFIKIKNIIETHPRFFVFFICLISLLRRSWTRYIYPHLWAEDGALFLKEFSLQGWESLLNQYGGYYHTIPRIITGLLTFLPFEYLAKSIVIVCLLITSGIFSKFASKEYMFAVKSTWIRIIFCFLLTLAPGLNEILGNLTNIHWILSFGIFLFIVKPAHSKFSIVETTFVGLSVLSSGVSFLFLPALSFKIFFHRHSLKTDWNFRINLALFGLIASGIFLNLLNRSHWTPHQDVSLNTYLEAIYNLVRNQIFFQPLIGPMRTGAIANGSQITAMILSLILGGIFLIGIIKRTQCASMELLIYMTSLFGYLFIPVMTWIVRPESVDFFMANHGVNVSAMRYGFQIAPPVLLLWIISLEGLEQFRFLNNNRIHGFLLHVVLSCSVFCHIKDRNYLIYRYGTNPEWQETVLNFNKIADKQCSEDFYFSIYPSPGWSAFISANLCKKFQKQ